VARLVGDVGLAEELTQDVVVTALQRWPSAGVPDNPGGWLMHAAASTRSTTSAAGTGWPRSCRCSWTNRRLRISNRMSSLTTYSG
jgi:hypothetical protein